MCYLYFLSVGAVNVNGTLKVTWTSVAGQTPDATERPVFGRTDPLRAASSPARRALSGTVSIVA